MTELLRPGVGKVVPASDALQEILERRTALVRQALDALVIAQLEGDSRQVQLRQQDVGDVLMQSAALADLIGRRRLWLELDSRVGPDGERRAREQQREPQRSFALGGPTPVAAVPFEQAVTALLERDPRLAVGWREVQRVYTRQRGFSLAKVVSQTLVRKVTDAAQILLAQGARAGVAPVAVQDQLIALAAANNLPLTKAYVETVYRTNMATAFTAGRLRQAQDPAVRAVTPGFRYDAVGDADTRENHMALDGLLAAQDDPVWQQCSPPLGYNCRCTLALATRRELEAAGVIQDGRVFAVRKPAGGGPDPGFAKVGRTDSEVYPPGPAL